MVFGVSQLKYASQTLVAMVTKMGVEITVRVKTGKNRPGKKVQKLLFRPIIKTK